MNIFYVLLFEFFSASNFGYNTSLLSSGTFGSHYIQTSVQQPIQNNYPQTIQRKKLVTQSTVKPQQTNYYQKMFLTPPKPKQDQKNNLIIFNKPNTQQNLLTLQKLIQQQQKYQANENKASANEVIISQPLRTQNQNNEAQQNTDMFNMLQQLQDQQQQPKIEFEQPQITQQENNEIIQQLFQEQNIPQQPPQIPQMDNDFMNMQQQQDTISQPGFDVPNFDQTKQEHQEEPMSIEQQLNQMPQFDQPKKDFSEFNIQFEPQQPSQESSNPFLQADMQKQQQPAIPIPKKDEDDPYAKMYQNAEKIDMSGFEVSRDFSESSTSTKSPFEQAQKAQTNQPHQQDQVKNFQKPMQESSFEKPAQKSQNKEITSKDEKPNLFSVLSFDELMELRGISQDKVDNDQSVSFIEFNSIGKNRSGGSSAEKKGIGSLFGPSSEPEHSSPPSKPSPPPPQSRPTRQYKPPTFITEDSAPSEPSEYIPSNRPDDPFANFNQPEPEAKPAPKQEPSFDPFAEYNKQQEEKSQPKKQETSSGNPFDEFNSGFKDERFSSKNQSFNNFSPPSSSKSNKSGEPFSLIKFLLMENQKQIDTKDRLTEPILDKEYLLTQDDEEENDQTLQNKIPKKKNGLSNATNSQIKRLSNIRKKNILKRIFRKLQKGSLRYVVLLWIRMTVGVGILTLPKLCQFFGLIGGIIAIITSGMISYLSFTFIVYASQKQDTKEFFALVQKVLPRISVVFKYTYFMDLISFGIIYSIFGYKLFEFILQHFGLMKEEWIKDPQTLEYYEYSGGLFLLRVCYFSVLYIILVPLLLKEDLDRLKGTTFIFLGALVFLVIDIVIEAPFFRDYYINSQTTEQPFTIDLFKPISWSYIPNWYSIMSSYYVQPLTLLLRKELLHPTKQRLKKVRVLAVLIETLVYIVFVFVVYYCYGEGRVPDLIILRKPYPEKSAITENIAVAAIAFFFVFTNLGLPVFNPGVRQYIKQYTNFENGSAKYIVASLAPFFAAFVISTLYPSILGMFGYLGLSFCNFNGYIIPALLCLNTLEEFDQSKKKQFLLKILIIFYVSCGVIGIAQKIMNF